MDNIMDNIKHWWGITKYLTKFNDEGAKKCQMYFVQRCKQLSQDIELPKQHFGPSVMCSHCGSMWSKNEPQIRIVRGKPCSKSVKQIIKSCSENNRLSRFHSTLMKKSLKNKMNKIVYKCSVCSKNTEINCAKPSRLKLPKGNPNKNDSLTKQKKKKKKVRDRTAGLNIPHTKSPDMREKKEVIPLHSTPTVITIKKKPMKKELTPLQKVRKMNLNKLNNILNEGKVQKSRNSLSNFLKELY